MYIKTIHTFIIGSNAFFNNIEGFTPHDNDLLHIINMPIFDNNIYIIRNNDTDEFLMYNSGKDKLLKNIKDPLQVGKFLVTEFAEYINLTIEDLKKIEHWFDKLDDKHKYEKSIYQYYIINKGFFLTDKQLINVYNEYKKYR